MIMKKMMIALVALFAFVASASAMSYEQARQQALFLTDKMAYELNLTEEQYEAAYEVNLDYLMGVNTQADLYGIYWERRNLDLSYILLDWQYRMYLDATYFYRPLYWRAGYWHFGIYARYPHRDYFYFGRPRFYSVYRGGHAWHMNGGRSWYHGRTFAPVGRSRNDHFGMHNRFERGDYGRGNRGFGTQNHGNGNFNNGNYSNRGSNRPGGVGNDGNRNLGGGHRQHNGNGTMQAKPNTQGPAMGSQQNRGNFNNQHGSFGGSRPSSTRTTGRQFEGNSRSNSTTAPRSTFTPSRSVRSVGSPSRSSAPSRSISPSRSSSLRSVGAPTRSSAPSRSFSAPSRSSSSSHSSMGSSRSGGSHGGGASRGGGGHFGGRR